MRITKLTARDFMAFEEFEHDVPEGGLVVAGGNGKGKSTVLRLVQQGLLAQGVSPSSVRLGAEKARIEIALGDTVVQRLIQADGSSTVKVKTPDGTRAKPQAWLSAISGSTLDPLAIFFAPAKERRALVLKALPVTVTREQLRAWWPEIPATFDTSGHGLEVLARAHRAVYEQRTAANAAAKAARADADRLAGEAAAHPGAPDGPDVAEASNALTTTQRALAAIESRAAEHTRAVERTATTRAKIEDLRRTAADLHDPHEPEASTERAATLRAEIADLERTLADRRAQLAEAERDIAAASDVRRRCEAATQHADALEATLAASIPEPVAPEAISNARAVVMVAEQNLSTARTAAEKRAAAERARAAQTAATNAETDAKRLDSVVRVLADDAPKALPGADAIPGLSVDGDDVTLDGKRLDALCGAEQLRLAVQIAKRARSECELPLLVVDGLERLDEEQYRAFLDEATRDGWQVLGTRVTGGDLHFEAIEVEDDAEWSAA